jgi:hypothetical protein
MKVNQRRMLRISVYKTSTKKDKKYWTNLLLNHILDRGILQREDTREIVVEALKAFWLPVVCLNREEVSVQELEDIYSESIRKLESQIVLLKQMMPQEIKSETEVLEREAMDTQREENPQNNLMLGML